MELENFLYVIKFLMKKCVDVEKLKFINIVLDHLLNVNELYIKIVIVVFNIKKNVMRKIFLFVNEK